MKIKNKGSNRYFLQIIDMIFIIQKGQLTISIHADTHEKT